MTGNALCIAELSRAIFLFLIIADSHEKNVAITFTGAKPLLHEAIYTFTSGVQF